MKKKRKSIRTLFLTALFLWIIFMTGCGEKSYFQTKEEMEQGSEDSDAEDADKNNSASDDDSASENAETECYVDVSGAVLWPGVYRLPAGSRVFEALQMAGGLREDADIRDLNQAAVISDGQKLYIYTVGEQELSAASGSGESAAQSSDGRININTASKEQLMTLSGIGESKADAIITYREEHGNFSSPEDIKKIAGIKEGVYSKIADSIRVN